MPDSSAPFARLLNYARTYRQHIRLAMGCSVLNKLFDLAPPALIGVAINVVVEQDNSLIARFGVISVFHQLLVLSFLTLIVWGLESAFEYAYARLWRNLAQHIQNDLRLEAYGHLQELEMAFFEQRSTGELMSILNDDVNQLEHFLDGGANALIQVATTVVIVGATFFALTPLVAVMAMLPMPFILWGSLMFQRKLIPLYGDVREKVGLLAARLANNLGGMATIKSFTAEAFESDRLRIESDAYRQSNRRAIAVSAAFVPLIRIIILMGFTATLFVGGMQAANGALDVGVYGTLVFLTQRLLWPLTRLGETLDEYRRAMASTTRIMNLLDTPIAIRTGLQPLPLASVQGELKFERVTFAYADRPPVLTDLSLHVPAGQTIAVVGPTGSGKSTLVKLLLRFYEIDRGHITLDDQELHDLNLKDLRRAIGLVSQDVFLFHGTVAENIRYGSFDATDEEVMKAAKLAEAHEFVEMLPQGYDTIVGERGQRLSGGQRQRLAIARAILKDPPVLILDEATSAVDNETEAAIQRSLEKISRGRTVIAIAHRLSTIRNTDRIYVMEGGQITEQGRHDELVAQDGLYTSLWQVQMGNPAVI
ncbi:MAG: ABC transporter ATP-binding protein [Cyanobacteria bacterium P01_E01_bin.34]